MMRVLRVLVAVVCVWAGITLLQAPVVEPQVPVKRVPKSPLDLAVPGEPIAGIPSEEALKIYERNVQALYKLEGVESVSFVAGGLMVATFKPELLPATVEGLPVIPMPPHDPRTIEHLDPGVLPPPEPIPLPEHPEVAAPPLELQPCGPGRFRSPGEVRCRWLTPPAQQVKVPEPKFLPPPSGVIVLKPDKVREQAAACPQRFEEVEGHGGWRFCVDPQNPETIPPLWQPPIAGIPFEQAQEIIERHTPEFSKLPGIESFGLGADGIHIETKHPEFVPKEVEGVPIIVEPSTGEIRRFLNHTSVNPIRPLHGAVAIDQSPGQGVLTGVALSQGHPWLIFPAHLLDNCTQMPPCATGPSSVPLNSCDHHPQPGQTIPIIRQPPGGSQSLVGFTMRWTQLSRTISASDVAAAFMDSDTIEDNGSLSADRRVHTDSEGISFLGTPIPVFPTPGARVTLRGGIGPPHAVTLVVSATNRTVMDIEQPCAGLGQRVALKNQILYAPDPQSSYFVTLGDSGSPIFDSGNRLVGMLNWCKFSSAINDCTTEAGGTDAIAIKAELKFDQWYGTQTAPDCTIGVFRPGSHQWVLDNGNGRIDACGTDLRFNDTCLGPLGSTGEYPVVGNWTGRGVYTVGQYRIGTFIPSINLWLLDTNGNGAFNDDCFKPGGDWCPGLSISQPTDIGVVGDWNGDGRIKIGQFRPSTAQWFLDWNGNGVWDGCGVDRCYTFGMPNDRPVVGDWTGDGRTKIGTFRNGTFRLDVSGDGIDGAGDRTTTYGIAGDTPVVGDWSGVGRSQIGIFRFENGQGLWGLDTDNSGTFTGCARDICYAYGVPGDVPVTWRPSTVRAN